MTLTPEALGLSIRVVYEDPLFLTLTAGAADPKLETITTGEPVLTFPLERCPDAVLFGTSTAASRLKRCNDFFSSFYPRFGIVGHAPSTVTRTIGLQKGKGLPLGFSEALTA